jgi:hypothetical protein
MYIAEVQVKGQEDPVFTLTKPVPDPHLRRGEIGFSLFLRKGGAIAPG